MERQQRRILAAAGLAALVLGGVAWAQVQQATRANQPTETALTPSRAQAAELGAARQSPMAERMRIVLSRGQDQGALLRQVQASTVPVLAPADPTLLADARFYPGEDVYTLVLRSPERTIQIFGSTKVFAAPEGAIPAPGPTTPDQTRGRLPLTGALAAAQRTGLTNTRVERTEYGVDVSFVRFGAVYAVTFVCEDLNSLECSDAAAVQFATGLELIGGGS